MKNFMKSILRKTSIILLLSMTLISSLSYAVPTTPVYVGGSVDMDACGGYGIITAPTTLFTLNAKQQIKFEIVKLNQMVFMCESDESGEFIGIVFSESNQDCKVSSPIENR